MLSSLFWLAAWSHCELSIGWELCCIFQGDIAGLRLEWEGNNVSRNAQLGPFMTRLYTENTQTITWMLILSFLGQNYCKIAEISTSNFTRGSHVFAHVNVSANIIFFFINNKFIYKIFNLSTWGPEGDSVFGSFYRIWFRTFKNKFSELRDRWKAFRDGSGTKSSGHCTFKYVDSLVMRLDKLWDRATVPYVISARFSAWERGVISR